MSLAPQLRTPRLIIAARVHRDAITSIGGPIQPFVTEDPRQMAICNLGDCRKPRSRCGIEALDP